MIIIMFSRCKQYLLTVLFTHLVVSSGWFWNAISKKYKNSFKCVLLTSVLRWTISIARERGFSDIKSISHGAFSHKVCCFCDTSQQIWMLYMLRDGALCPLHTCCRGKEGQAKDGIWYPTASLTLLHMLKSVCRCPGALCIHLSLSIMETVSGEWPLPDTLKASA